MNKVNNFIMRLLMIEIINRSLTIVGRLQSVVGGKITTLSQAVKES
jgi:hypothetical protein